jgi:hypothetical protein
MRTDLELKQLSDGNYIASPAWIDEFFRVQQSLLKQLRECEAGKND